MFKKWDIIIIILLLIFSFIPEVFLGVMASQKYNSVYAEITVEGKLLKKINLSENNKEEIIEVMGSNGKNVIKVNSKGIGIIEADCHDKICMKPEYIKNVGESLVCLPNRLMIQIKGNKEDDIIISY